MQKGNVDVGAKEERGTVPFPVRGVGRGWKSSLPIKRGIRMDY